MRKIKLMAFALVAIGAIAPYVIPTSLRVEMSLMGIIASSFFVPAFCLLAYIRFAEIKQAQIGVASTSLLIEAWDEGRLQEEAYLEILKDDKGIRREYIPKELRKMVLARDNYTCVWCGKKGTTSHDHNGETHQIDHVIPCSRGGKTVPANLATTCRSCNHSKTNKTPVEYLGYIKRTQA